LAKGLKASTSAGFEALFFSGDLMTTSLFSEKAMSLASVAKAVPFRIGEYRVTTTSLWRWATSGGQARPGEVLRLEAVRIGGRWVTSVAAVERFVQALTNRGQNNTGGG
jgi:hypothetical protein